MKCAKCGQPLDPGATFCGNCGNPVSLAAGSDLVSNPGTPSEHLATGTAVPGAAPAAAPASQPAPAPQIILPPVVAEPNSGKATAALVLGIIALLTWLYWPIGLPVAVVGLIMGILSRKTSKKGMAIAGIVMSAIGIALSLAMVVLTVLITIGKVQSQQQQNSTTQNTVIDNTSSQ